MEEERGSVWAEWRHDQHSCWVVSYPAKKDRIICVQPEEEPIADELLGLCRANSTLSTQELKSICKTKRNAIKEGRSGGAIVAGADASLVAPLALSDGGGALACPPLPPPALDS